MIQQLIQYYLPFFLVAYLLITFVIPGVRVYRKTGINPVTFGKQDNAHDYIGLIMKVLTALLAITVFTCSFGKTAAQYFAPFTWLANDFVQATGFFFIHSSLVWIVIAQHQMKQSWRIGIDENNPTQLIRSGLFSVSRNPIFLGMIVSTAGIFLILPNALAFFIAAASYIVIQIQIRLEEEYLLKAHGMVYSEYKKKVRRLL